jgi:hypothetical protein
MEHIAQSLVTPAVPCLDARLYDRAPATPGVQAECAVTERVPRDDAPPVDVAVRGCDDTAGVTPCWRVAADARCAGKADGLAITVDHGAGSPAFGARSRWTCRIAN